MDFFLGIDIGTSNIKNIIFDEKWNEIFSISSEVSTIMSAGGYCEQSPVKIVSDVDLLLERSLTFAKESNFVISAIGLSSAMHSFMAVDEMLQPLSPLMIWSDTRAYQFSKNIKENTKLKAFVQDMNVPVHPMLPLAKWLWYRENSYHRTAKILSLKDFLVYHWFGNCITDISIAGATGYFDIQSLDWNRGFLSALNLPSDCLPEVAATTKILTEWTKSSHDRFSKHHLPPVVLGSSDGCLANLAAGVTDSSRASLTLGTSGAIRTATSEPLKPGTGLFCYPVLPGYYVAGGATNNGGNVLQWFNLAFDPENSSFWQELEEVLSDPSHTNSGLLFVPYLFGERAPVWEPEVRASFVGISNMHNKKHFLRASIEGVAFSLKHLLNKLINEGNKVNCLTADGGFTQSESWVQLVCDVLGVKIEVPETSYGAAKGAAMLANMALTERRLAEIINHEEIKKTYYPDRFRTEKYELAFRKYLRISDFIIRELEG